MERYLATDFNLLHEFNELYADGVKHDLASGVPVLPIGGRLQELTTEYLTRGDGYYSSAAGEEAFRAAALEALAREGVTGRSVLATAGATGGLVLAMMSILQSGDEVLVFEPDYAYAPIAHLLGVKTIACPLPDDFRISISDVQRRLTPKTRIIALSNPSNPVGLVTVPATLRELSDLAAKANAWILCDEVYADFAGGTGFQSAANFGEKVIVVRSLSKSMGLAGWRIGYCVGCESIIARMRDVQEFTFICAPVISQHVAAALLREEVDRSVFAERPGIVCDLLRKAEIRFVEPEAGFFVYVEAPGSNGLQFTRTCFQNGIAVVPGAMFDPRDTHVRVSFAGEWTRTMEGIAAFAELYRC